MKSKSNNLGSNSFVIPWNYILLLSLTSILIVPWWVTDGFNTGKLIALVIFALFFVSKLGYREIKLKLKVIDKRVILLILIFPINLILVFAFSEANKLQQLYGEFGRRTGLLTYLAFFILFIYHLFRGEDSLRKIVIKTLTSLGFISALYSILQPSGFFQINDLQSKNLSPYSFFGNSNFHSGFLGLASITVLPQIMKKTHWKKFLSALLLYAFLLYAISYSDSEQGFIIGFSGVIIYLNGILLNKYKNYYSILIAFFVNFSLVFIFIQGLIGKGIAAIFLYQDSVMARNYYWDAAWSMAKDRPFLGVGLDRYGDWYWAYRASESINKLGPEDFSTSAHSIFLDLASSGGVILLLTYLTFVFTIFYISIKNLISMDSLDYTYLTLFACWVSLNVYSLFSIGHIGVFVWSWVFAGLLISKIKGNSDYMENNTVMQKTTSKSLIGILIGLVLIFPVINESIQSKKAQKINSVASYLNYLDSNTLEPRNIALAIKKLSSSSVNTIEFTRDALVKFPNYYDLWYALYINPSTSEKEKREALSNLIRLNYYNSQISNGSK